MGQLRIICADAIMWHCGTVIERQPHDEMGVSEKCSTLVLAEFN
jgi:hypothetical protein